MNIKNKIKKIFVCIAIMTSILYGSVNAKTIYNISHDVYYMCDILQDGNMLVVPNNIKFQDGYELDLNSFHTILNGWNSSIMSFNEYKQLRITSLFSSNVHSEYAVLLTGTGGPITINSSVKDKLDRLYKINYILYNKEYQLPQYQDMLIGETNQAMIDLLNKKISTLTQEIADLKNVSIDDISTKKVIAAIPYIGRGPMQPTTTDGEDGDIIETYEANYYIYSIIYRDLRLSEITYTVDNEEYKAVPSFNKDTYEYTVNLPTNVAKNVTIKTKSKSYMEYVLEYNNINDCDLDLEVRDTSIELVNGKGKANITVFFDNSGYPGCRGIVDPLNRTYTINFEVSEHQKGDLNKDGIVDSVDTAIALTKYKNNSTTSEDISLGDMNNDGVLDPTDAAMILTIYKKN